MKGQANKLAPRQALTEAQRLGVEALQGMGFALVETGRGAIRLRKGNDFRVVCLDGTQRRIEGAKR